MCYYVIIREFWFWNANKTKNIKLIQIKREFISFAKYAISCPISAYHYIDESEMDDYMMEGSKGEMRLKESTQDINPPPPLPRARNHSVAACSKVTERVVIDLVDDGYEIPSLPICDKPEEPETAVSNVIPDPILACPKDENVSCDRALQFLSMDQRHGELGVKEEKLRVQLGKDEAEVSGVDCVQPDDDKGEGSGVISDDGHIEVCPEGYEPMSWQSSLTDQQCE